MYVYKLLIIILVLFITRRFYRLIIPCNLIKVEFEKIKFKTGDLLLFSNSKMMRFITSEMWTHVAVVVRVNNEYYAFEISPKYHFPALIKIEKKILKNQGLVAYRKINRDVDNKLTRNFIQRMRLERYSHMTYIEYTLRSFISHLPHLFLPLDTDRHHYYSCCSTLASNYLINAGVISEEAYFPWDFARNLKMNNGYLYSNIVEIDRQNLN